MKVLILGDLHCRPVWKDIVTKEGKYCDKIVFLGDYLPPREIVLDDPTDACGFLYDVLNFIEENKEKAVGLRGNHCMQMLGYYWGECRPQIHPKVAQYCQTEDVKNWYLKNTQWVYIIPETNIVCSHAGIGKYFLNECIKKCRSENKSVLEQISEINRLTPSELFGFTSNSPFDINGESPTQPCTWIRPYTLLEHGVKAITHVVGHTPIKHICNVKEACIKLRNELNITEEEEEVNNYCNIWCCDNLEVGEYLIIEDGEFKPCKL